MKPFVTACFIIFVVCYGFSQNIKTDLNIQAYGNVLIQSKKQYINIDSIINEILFVQNISETRYAEIIKSEFEGKKLVLNQQEKSTIEKIAQASNKLKNDQQENIIRLCNQNGITIDQYREIEKMVTKDPEIRQQLIHYFEQKSLER
ncbi:MAG TPA: hypothetical protein PJ990_07600 [Saprospiraceae bacterium]|nr:hypothetical protein [Saprospiraceae bacterium]